MDPAEQFKPAPPDPYGMPPGSAFRGKVMDVYHVVRNLTKEQRATTAFWAATRT